ncbi:HNH endonuclease, partial [Streptomyces sp. MBT60]|nr:HNH endonuclease [Streptomyces sp. MBT60]
MSLRRLGFLSAALLTAATLTACSAEPVEADDPKPSPTGTT